MTSIRPVACKCTAGGASPERLHSSGGQPRGSRLVSCTCIAVEAWAGCRCDSQAPVGEAGRLVGKTGGTQVAGVSKHKYPWGESQ